MRIVESFNAWLASQNINENISAAKIYMQKRYAKRLRKDPNTLTPEERDKALTDPADRKSTRLNSSHTDISRMPSSA